MDRRSFFRSVGAGVAGITAAALPTRPARPKQKPDKDCIVCNGDVEIKGCLILGDGSRIEGSMFCDMY